VQTKLHFHPLVTTFHQ